LGIDQYRTINNNTPRRGRKMNPIGWEVVAVDNYTGEEQVLATTKSGDQAKRIARNAGTGEGYKVVVRLY
jgi:ribosomal protein L32E